LNKKLANLCTITSLVLILIGCSSTNPSVTTPNDKSVSINMANFDKVHLGMSLEELEGAVGGKGYITYIGKYSTYYQYAGNNSSLAYAVFRFDGSQLSVKNQIGIK